MSKEKKRFPNLPPGFSEEDFTPVNIEGVKKTKTGFEIDLKPKTEKEEDAEYHFKLRKGVYHILCNNSAIYTPNDKKVTVFNEALAKRTVDHLNLYGEEYEMPYSIVNFLYSYLDFFEEKTKEELDSPILVDYEYDWLLELRVYDPQRFNKLFSNFSSREKLLEDYQAWLQTLTKLQTGAVIILGATLRSVHTARVLSTTWNNADLKQVAKEYFMLWQNYSKTSDDYFFWKEDDIVKIFENYLFWQGLEI